MRDIHAIAPSFIIIGIQDSLAFWIPHSGFRILGNGFQIFVNATWIPDSNRWRNSGFLELYEGFKGSQGFRIPQAKMSRILESGFPYMGRQERTMMANFKSKAKDEPKSFFFLSLSFSPYCLLFSKTRGNDTQPYIVHSHKMAS